MPTLPDKEPDYGLDSTTPFAPVRACTAHPLGLASLNRAHGGRQTDSSKGWNVDDQAAQWRWERERAALGLARDTPDQEFARGGLAALAVDPTTRITVLPRDASAQPVPAENPETVIPKVMTLPGGTQLAYHETVRGTSSGYVGFTTGADNRWQNFSAVLWHGGVDVFAGASGGRTWRVNPDSERLVIFLRRCVGWAWAAFDLQRELVKRYGVAGPFRAIVGIASTEGAVLGNVGAGWAEPGTPDGWDLPTAVEKRVLLVEDLPQWPDETGAQELALRFGARVDLAFGGPGQRHLDRTGPEAGRFVPRW